MATQTGKNKEVLNSLLGNGEPTPTSDDESSPLSVAGRKASEARHVSLEQLAAFLDRDPNTIRKWVKAELPFIEQANRDLGVKWKFDTAEVVRWMEKRAADTVAEKLGTLADGMTSEGEAKRRRGVAAAIILEIEAAEAVKTVVRVSHVIERIASDYAEIRQRLVSIPDAIAGRVEAKLAPRVKQIADEQIRNAIASLKVDRELVPPAGE